MAIIIVMHDEGKLSKMCTVTVKSGECSHVAGATVKENVIASTCSAAGSHDDVVYCSICSAEMSRVTVADAKKAHNFTSKTKTATYLKSDATCTNAAVYYYKCADCSAKGTTTYTNGSALGHTGGTANCTDKAVCTRCNTEYGSVNANNHKSIVTDKSVAATCTANGKSAGSHCSACGVIIEAQETVSALGHTSDSGTVTKKATCTQTGTKTYKCTACDEVIKTETIKKTEHKLVVIPAVEATCTTVGKTEGKKCSVCGTFTVAPTDVTKKAHSYKNVVTKATLTANGKVTPICSVCGAKKTATAIYMPKTFTLSATKATYTGKAIKPTVTVKDSKGNVIDAKYYTITYADNTNVGTATVTVKFKTNYSGTKTLNFTIVPKQVTGLKSSAEKTTSLKLTWTKVTGAKYYKVEQSTDGKTWKAVKTVGTNSITVSKLTAGRKYQFRVTAFDTTKKLVGKVSTVLKTGTLTAVPTVTLKSSKSKTAVASWKKVTGASKYAVYKSTDGKKWTKVTTTTKLTYTLTKLTGGKKIYVKVTAVNAYSKESAASAVKNVTVKK
ncbi:MAG: fibronectin type III domain-containing protein [Clostridia bacterium]|nr:fibronectin type III domain-containing protein [Clostridia bacterium]